MDHVLIAGAHQTEILDLIRYIAGLNKNGLMNLKDAQIIKRRSKMNCPKHPEIELKKLRLDSYGCPSCGFVWFIHPAENRKYPE